MTVKELKDHLAKADDAAIVLVNDEPIGDVEVVPVQGKRCMVIIWDVSHCEGT